MTRQSIKVVMLGPSLQQKGGMATVENLILKHEPSGVEIQHICTHDEGSLLHRGKVFIKALILFLEVLLKNKIYLVHIHLSERGSVLRKGIFVIIAFLFRKPVLIHTHGAEFESFFLSIPDWTRQVLSLLFRHCDGFIVLSKTWEKFYVNTLGLTPHKVFILPNAIEIPHQISEREDSDFVRFVFFGRVGQRKGTFDLINAVANLSVKHQAYIRLSIAGDGEIAKARELVEKLGLTDQVTFLGWIGEGQKEQILRCTDVFVLPSYNEGLPMAILEAMSWGLPIISTPVGGIPEVIISNHNGLLVEPGNIGQLSTAMQRLLEDGQLRHSLGSNARLSVQSFDVKAYRLRLADIYQTILGIMVEIQ